VEAEPGDLAVAVEADPQHRLAGLEAQQHVGHGAVAGQGRGHLTRALVAPEHADHVRPSAGEAVNVVALAHELVEAAEHLLPAARGEAGQEPGYPLDRVVRDSTGHRLASAGVDRVPEPLERGLPADAEHVTDFPPALPGGPGAVDGRLQCRLGCGRQVPCGRHDIPRRGAAGELLNKAACRISNPDGHGVVCAGRAFHNVKIFLTILECQIFLYILYPSVDRTPPSAACR
jgi:hypothetical protein